MPNLIKNLGLGFLTKTDEDAMKFMYFVAHEGTPITGYYGWPYLNAYFGDAQFILRTRRDSEQAGLELWGRRRVIGCAENGTQQ